MKLARLFLAVLTASTLAACADSVTAPSAESARPALNTTGCPTGYTLEEVVSTNGTVTYRCNGMAGSGG